MENPKGIETRRTRGGRTKSPCLSSKALVRAFLDTTSREEKFRILDHVAECPDCGREFDALAEIRRKSEAWLSPIPAAADPSEYRRTAHAKYRELKAAYRGNGTRSPFRRRIYAVAGAAALLILSIITYRSWMSRGTAEVEREIAPWEVRLLSPREAAPAPILFKWTHVANARGYDLEILDSALQPVLSIPQVMNENYLLTRDEAAKLRPGATYFWKITATLDTLQRIESNLVKFCVRSE